MSDKEKKGPAPASATKPSRLENVVSKKPSGMAFDSAPIGLKWPSSSNKPDNKGK